MSFVDENNSDVKCEWKEIKKERKRKKGQKKRKKKKGRKMKEGKTFCVFTKGERERASVNNTRRRNNNNLVGESSHSILQCIGQASLYWTIMF